MKTWVALVRGIGAKTHKVMPLKSLAESLGDAGLLDVKSVLATGNFVFRSALDCEELEKIFSRAIKTFELNNPVFLRTPQQIEKALAVNPFAEAAEERPNHLLVHFTAKEISGDAEESFSQWTGPEHVHFDEREFYIFFVDGIGTSKLTPAKIERFIGQPSTARNWNTLHKLIDAAEVVEDK